MTLQAIIILAGSASGFVSAFLAVFAVLRLKETRAALPFALLMLANCLYAAAYTFEINSPGLASALAWLKLEYLGVSTIPVFWFIFARAFSRGGRPLGAIRIVLLFVVPIITIGLMLTKDSQGMIYTSLRLREGLALSVIVGDRGPWYWVSTVYLYILMLYGTVGVVGQAFRVSGKFRGQMIILSIGAILPWLGHVLLLVRASPLGLDLSPFLLAVSGGLFSLAIFKFSIFDLVPIARDMAVDAMRDGVFVIDRKGRLVDANRAALSAFPLPPPLEMGSDAAAFFLQVGFDLPEVGKDLDFSLGQEGALRQYRASCLEIKGESGPRGRLVILSDMTKEKEILARLELLVCTDELTQVDNRRRFFEHAARELELAQRRASPISFAMLDLDNFKAVNDSHGHAAGDSALVAVCAACREILRSTDILCRFGGEEFMIILPEAGPSQAYEIIERVRKRIGITQIGEGEAAFSVTASFGIAGSEGPPRDRLETYLRRSDEAMYRAKSAGRNRTVLAQG